MKRLMVVFAAAALVAGVVMPRFSHQSVRDHLIFFREAAPAVIRAMNDCGSDADRALLPYSSYRLVKHFRAYKKARR